MDVRGRVEPQFEAVRAAFVDNFVRRGEVGAAFAVWYRGRPVVALHGGTADVAAGRPWGPDTSCVLFSATKGLVATAFLILADRGEIDLDAPVSDHWPAFSRGDKALITVRMLLNHRSGLCLIDEPLNLADFRPPAARVAHALASQTPRFSPDAQQAYGATAWGAYTAMLFEQVTGVSVGRWLRDEVTGPLGAAVYLGLRPDTDIDRATLIPVSRRTFLTEQIPEALFRRSADARLFRRVLLSTLGARTTAGRALLNPTLGPRRFGALNDPAILELELPWMNGVGSALGLARVYAALVSEVDGVRLVRPEAIEPLRRRQTWSSRDRVLQKAIGWSQGFVKEEEAMYSPNPASFGHPGAGGAVGWADPDHALGLAYVMNRMDWRVRSPRALALTRAVYACL